MVDRGSNSPNRKCSIRDFDLARLRVCPGKPGAGNPHAGFYLGGEAQGQPRLLPTDHNIRHHLLLAQVAQRVNDPDVLHVLKLMLQASGKKGVAQGGVLSPLLSNLYLTAVDRMLERAKEVTRRGPYPFLE